MMEAKRIQAGNAIRRLNEQQKKIEEIKDDEVS